jgi:hypothetical protein
MNSERFVFNFSRAFMRDICANKFPKYCSVLTKQRERGTISHARYIYDYPGMQLVTRSLHYPIINLMNYKNTRDASENPFACLLLFRQSFSVGAAKDWSGPARRRCLFRAGTP